MNKINRKAIFLRAGQYMDEGYHCSESILLAVGGYYWGDERAREALRFATPFAGGVGGTNEELCGALSGGLMVIGGLYGRRDGPLPDQECQDLGARFRAEFLREFGWLKCRDLKEHWIGTAEERSCKLLVEKASEVLIRILEAVDE